MLVRVSPKFHSQEFTGPVEVSVKVTASGRMPFVGAVSGGWVAFEIGLNLREIGIKQVVMLSHLGCLPFGMNHRAVTRTQTVPAFWHTPMGGMRFSQ